MKHCVAYDTHGYLHITDDVVGSEACTLVIGSREEIELYPFNLSMEEGSQIAGAIAAVWAVALGVRLIKRLFF